MNNLLEAARPTRRQVAALTLSGLAVAGTATAAIAASSDLRSVSATQRATDQQRLLDLINVFRAQNGLRAVRHSATVATVMQAEAERQVRAGYFSHGTEFIYNPSVQGYSFVREVIALSYNDDLNVLINFWKGSPAHRAAVLAPQANVMGIGLAYGHGTSLPWRVLGNVGIYEYQAGRGPNDYVSNITADLGTQSDGSKEVPAFALTGAIGNHYYARGGANFFGQPTGNEFRGADGGVIQHFSYRRSIYWSADQGAHTIFWGGSIGRRFAGANYENGLGYPMNSEYMFWSAVRQDFMKGGRINSVYWTPSTGARVINESGAISARWYSLGGPPALGFPTTDETMGSDGVIRVSFSKGVTINWSADRGVWVN